VFGISPEMASALTDPLRSRILMEINTRPLSPSQFAQKTGGDLSRISRCFRQLERWGYAEVIEERPGRRRGAAIEHVYRGIQRAQIDTSTWMELPQSRRDAFSRSILDSYFAHIADAIEAGTFDQERDRHLSWNLVVLDRPGWNELGERLDEILAWLPELEVDAAGRRAKTTLEAIPATIGLASFRSPVSPEVILVGSRQRYPDVVDEPATRFEFSLEMAKALSNRWRSRILAQLAARPMSPSQFVEEVGGDPSYIARCFRELAKWRLIEVVEERRGGQHRGGVERIYRNTRRAYFDRETWEALPRFLRNELSNCCLATYAERISEALEADTFDAESDRHLSWKTVVLDREAWLEIVNELDAMVDWIADLERQSVERVDEEAERLIPTTIGLACFRAPAGRQL
jgi:predicted transcriptional regulator